MKRYYSAEPLIALLEKKYPEGRPIARGRNDDGRAALDAVPARPNCVTKQLQRLRKAGRAPWFQVDNVCITYLDLHPALVYGNEWWEED